MTVDEIATADALIGRVMAGKFCLRRCVGTGASGTVYQADQLALGRTVAIKILRPELTRDPRFVDRFHDEALAASRLNHPNTVSVIDYGQTDDGLLYLVMEFLRGPTLNQVLHSETLRPSRVADLVGQILAGLEEAHEAGVIHADLKADNVVVERRRGDWDLVKVVDFGIARLIGRETRSTERTICGTPEYMAPEVIQGEEPTFASDLYSVGVVLYELLTGSTPFAGGSSMDVLRRHLTEAPIPPSLRRPDLTIDPILEESALRALSKHPGRRFASATEFRVALMKVVGHRSDPGAAVGPCPACGASSPLSFKFCPDCGHPRHQISPELIMLDEISIGHAETAFGVPTPPPDVVTGAAVHASRTSVAEGTRPVPATLRPGLESRTGFLPDDESVQVVSRTENDLGSASLWLPLVGRDQELARLVDFLGGSGGDNALQLVGPRGAGRSRLIEEALARLAPHGLRVAIARPDPTGLFRPFYPLRGAVRDVLGLEPTGRNERLTGSLEQIGLSARDVPAVTELLGIEGPLWQLEPSVRRREILASLNRLFTGAAERAPLAVVLEDVDLYDHPSQEAIRRVIEWARGHGSLRIMISNEPALADMWPPSLGRIELGPLDSPALEQLVVSLREHARELGDDQPGAEQLALACGGMPGHINQLLRYVVEGGSPGSAPAGLADLLTSRIDHLPQAAKVVCQAIAVIGVQAPLRVLRAIVHEPEEAQLRQALSVLVARGILRDGGSPDEVGFASALLRDVVYDATPALVRRDLHELAAGVLEQIGADAAVLGHHHDMCGAIGRAAQLLSLAGDDAVHELDDGGARRLYQRALRAARQLMLSDDEPSLQAQFVGIAVKLAEQLRVGGELGLARGLIDEVRAHCRDSRALQAQVLRAAAHLASSEGDHAGAAGALREGIGLAIVNGQRDLICDLYLDMATTHLRESLAAEAVTELEEGVDLVTGGEGGRAHDGPGALWRMLYRLAQLHALEGRRDRAVEVGNHALRHAQRVGARVGTARIQSMLAGLLEQLGDRRRAHELRDQAIAEMRRLGDRRGTAELLLDGARPTESFSPITSSSLREAKELAQEIGWVEGERRARQVVVPGETGEL
ncbi:MAG TPA: protein kinase [Kofleriaceae bacterium]|nr:protein kinase [Kofleriaceae bacterium]